RTFPTGVARVFGLTNRETPPASPLTVSSSSRQNDTTESVVVVDLLLAKRREDSGIHAAQGKDADMEYLVLHAVSSDLRAEGG
ncbi:unnamed protein product, partial [Amoebophrya sp. A25]